MGDLVFVVNAGSSSVKTALFSGQLLSSPTREEAIFQKQTSFGRSSNDVPTVTAAVANSVRELGDLSAKISIVGHRVVHGGTIYSESVQVNDKVKENIAQLEKFAPLHNKLNLEGIAAVEQLLPALPQVAVFDTTFHRTIAEPALIYPGPYEWFSQYHIQRFGFHGINHQYASEQAARILGKKLSATNLIVCHLGNGCSISAVKDGASIDNSMGFTPLEGLMMGTRSGSIDPGILLHLLRHHGFSADQLDRTLNANSGLLGISGVSNDMRTIEEKMYTNERAKLAFDMFVYRLKSFIGAMSAHLPRIDAIVFTAGIGEHSAIVREHACRALERSGCSIDPAKNETAVADVDVAQASSAVRILVIAAGEEWQIARESWRVGQADKPSFDQA